MADQRTDRLTGRVLDGRFRLDEVLGSGGMGKVYSGVQLSVDRRVAVKVLREELSESETLAQRFFREAKVVASLRHPNIVGLVDFGRDEAVGSLYIAMEYVDGISLATLLRRGRLEAPLAVGIARQVCSALAEAHAAGVIHRDLKPDNVMLVTTAEGALSVKVLDFGIALPTGEEARLTSTGAVVGTPHYMAPEQAQDKPITPQSDIYSLGVLTYEMLTGRLPFIAETPMAVLLKVITQPPPPLHEVLAPEQMPPQALSELLSTMMSKEPTGRPQDIAAVAAHLDEITRTHDLVTPSISTQDQLVSLVVERASDEFVFAPTAASPVPTPSSPAAVPPVSTVGGAVQRPSTLAPPPPQKRWMWFIAPLLFMGCCCFPLVNIWLDNASKQASRTKVDAAMGDATMPDFGSIGTDASPTAYIDLGAPLEPVDPPTYPAIEDPPKLDTPPVPPQRPSAPTRPKLKSPTGPSVVETDGTVRSGTRGGNCLQGDCNWQDGPVACRNSARCTAMCPNGACPQLGFDQSTSVFDCDGGGCNQGCYGDANCVLQCSGGGCEQQCLTNGKCEKSCSGGGC